MVSRSARLVLVLTVLLAALASTNQAATTSPWQEQLTAARQAKLAHDWTSANVAYEAAARETEAFATDDVRIARTFEEISRAYASQNDSQRALAYQQRAVDWRTEHEPATAASVAEALYQMGRLYQRFNDDGEAEGWFRRSLEALDAATDAKPERTSRVLRALATLVQAQRPDDDEAEALLRRSVEVDDTPQHRAQLARYLADRDDHERAVAEFTAAIQLEGGRATPNLRHLAILLRQQAGSLRQLERWDDAEATLLRELEVRGQHLGPAHPHLAFTHRELGSLYLDLERYGDAEHHLLRARDLNAAAWGQSADQCSCNSNELLAQLQVALGRADARRTDDLTEPVRVGGPAVEPEVAGEPERPAGARRLDLLDEQVTRLRERGEVEPAIERAEQALELRAALYGAETLEYAEGLERLAGVLRHGARMEPALQIYEQRLELLQRLPGADDLQRSTALHSLGSLARQLGRDAEAERYFLDEHLLREGQGQALRSVRLLEQLAEVKQREKQPARAEAYLVRAIQDWLDLAGAEAPEMTRLVTSLARSLIAQERLVEAEAALVRQIEIEEAKARHDGQTLTQLLQPLKTVYERLGRDEAAAEVEQRLQSLRGLRNDYTAREGGGAAARVEVERATAR